MRDVAEIVDVIRDVSGVKWNSDVEELLGLHSGVLANLKKHRRMESFMTPLMEYCSNRGFNLQWFLTGEGDIYAEESKQYVWEPERFGPIQTRLRELENSEDEFTTLAHKLGLDFKAVDDEFGISRGDLEKYANKKGVRLQWILKGTGEKNLKRKIKFAYNLGNIQIGKPWRTTSEEANKTIEASPSAFQELIVNLLDNAIEAYGEAPQRNPLLEDEGLPPRWIKVVETAQARELTITIEDAAGGVTPKIAHQAFQPFITTAEDGSHAGLGLTVCASIAASMGGAVTLARTELGSKATVSLPLTESF